MPKFGPGTLTFGEEAASIDASCQVNECTLEPDKETGDSKTMLCGTVKPGVTTYTWTLNGNLDVDSDDPEGLFAYLDAHAGEQVPFNYTPSNGGTEAAGVIVADPLAFGGDEYGADMSSDFEFDVVGKPTYTYPTATPPEGQSAATFAQRVQLGRSVAGTPADVKVVNSPDDSSSPDSSSPDSSDSSDSSKAATTTKAKAAAK